MNSKISKLIRKFVKNTTSLEGEEFAVAVESAKKKYKETNITHRDALVNVFKAGAGEKESKPTKE